MRRLSGIFGPWLSYAAAMLWQAWCNTLAASEIKFCCIQSALRCSLCVVMPPYTAHCTVCIPNYTDAILNVLPYP